MWYINRTVNHAVPLGLAELVGHMVFNTQSAVKLIPRSDTIYYITNENLVYC